MNSASYVQFRKAVAEFILEETTPHLDKDGRLRAMWATDEGDEPLHGNPQDCLQCRVEEFLLGYQGWR